ncbi:hypothetical protein B0A58_09175 [Flavobacterium branchiophilum NBRC 15030 = ATCC 35035]|nr:hypothetical protein B0A58_09175 [Flavobacterium branchiophilum NBRC 15030 = ATCC 35035]
MMKAVLIEDELQLRKGLRLLLKKLMPSLQLVGESDSVSDGYQCIVDQQPDLLFLDIQINEGSSFDILEKLKTNVPHYTPKIIFITAYQQYAVKAFKYSVIDYILKPIDAEELRQVLDRVVQQTTNNQYPQIDLLLQHLNKPAETKKIALVSDSKTLIVPIEQLLRFEAMGNYTKVFLKDSRKIVTSKTLKEYDELLQTFGFERIHQSHLINRNEIISFSKKDNYVEMSCHSQVPISSKRMGLLDEIIKKITL